MLILLHKEPGEGFVLLPFVQLQDFDIDHLLNCFCQSVRLAKPVSNFFGYLKMLKVFSWINFFWNLETCFLTKASV